MNLRDAKEVLRLLHEYEGERIVKDKHLLHVAMSKLEQSCFELKSKPGRFRLLHPLDRIWYSLLWTSRGWTEGRSVHVDYVRRYFEEWDGKRNKQMALFFRDKMAGILRWRLILKDYSDGYRPPGESDIEKESTDKGE